MLGNHTNFISQYDNEIINYIEMKLKEEIEKNNIRKCDEHLTAFLIYKIFFSIFFEYDKDIQEEKIIKEVSSILEKGLIIEGGQNEKSTENITNHYAWPDDRHPASYGLHTSWVSEYRPACHHL